MEVRLLIDDEVALEGEGVPIPRPGDHIRRGDESFPVESVTWDLSDATVVVNVAVGTQPYTY